MKSLRRFQYDAVRTAYQRLLNNRGEAPDASTLRLLLNEIIYATERTPLSGKYRLIPYEPVDIDRINAELSLVCSDAETLFAFFSALQEQLRRDLFVVSAWLSYGEHRRRAIVRSALSLSSRAFIDGLTEIIDLAAQIDTTQSSVAVTDVGYAELVPVGGGTIRTVQGRQVTIDRIGTTAVATITGDRSEVFSTGTAQPLVLRLSGKEPREAGFMITLTTDPVRADTIHLELQEERLGVRVRIETRPENGTYGTIYDHVVTAPVVDAAAGGVMIDRLRISLTADVPNRSGHGRTEYEFILRRALILAESSARSGLVVLKPITIGPEVRQFTVVTEEDREGDAVIEYTLSMEEDAAGNPIGFSPINASEVTVIDMDRLPTRIELHASGERWGIVPAKHHGGRLYSLLAGIASGSYGELTVADGVMHFPSGTVAVQDSFELYRGVNDFARVVSTTTAKKRAESIIHSVASNSVTGWAENVDLLVRRRELIARDRIGDAGDHRYNAVTLQCPLIEAESLVVTRDDGREITARIAAVSESGLLVTLTEDADTPQRILSPAYNYYASYVTRLTNHATAEGVSIEVDVDSLSVSAGTDALAEERDYSYYAGDRRLALLRTGLYLRHFQVTDDDTGLDPLVVSYDYTEESITERVYWTTCVYVTGQTEITVLPFSSSEIEAGNFHRINGEDVSGARSVQLAPGWSTIETTQPYPTGAGEVNLITQQSSAAGMVLFGVVEQMRAYRDSMRQVSPFMLATLKDGEGAKCFAAIDGVIYVNFLPDAIDPGFYLDNPSTTGSFVYGRRPVWGTGHTVSGFTMQPEELELVCYHSADQSTNAHLRASLRCTTGVARIRRIGINQVRRA